jgi:RND family efflux transporter MFP subunit
MKNFILKNKKVFIGVFVVVIAAVFIFRIVQAKFSRGENQEETTARVSLLDVDKYQDEEVFVYTTGKVESLEQLDIKSELSAKVARVNFKIGQAVKKGQTILEMDNSILSAQLSQAQAGLNQRIAGASDEDIKIYQTAVDLAKADLEKTKADNKQAISSYEIALQMAENNLSLGGEILINALQSVQPVLSNSLIVADNILGIDNETANDSFEDGLSVLNSSKLNKAENSYYEAKKLKNEYEALLAKLNNNSSDEEVEVVAEKAEKALAAIKKHLIDVQEVLDATTLTNGFSQESFTAIKANVNALSVSANTVDTALTNAIQGKSDNGGNLNTYNIAYQKAKQDLENAKVSAENIIKIKEASYNQALANLEKIKADPRAVDIASLQAVVSQSAAAYNKSIIKAPFDGVISNLPFREGDLVAAGQVVAGVINREGLQIKAYVNQKERLLIGENNLAIIEDLYEGVVAAIAPSIDAANKKIEVIIAVAQADVNLAVGQYVNAKIFIKDSQSARFVIPLSAIKTYDGRKTVFCVNENNEIYEKEIEAGDIFGGNVKIIAGLAAGDRIISSVGGLSAGQKVIIE